MPELPEVQALADFLAERAVGRVLARADVTAVNVLKTYDPPLSALGGLPVVAVTRRGKFLNLDVSGLHLLIHLARAGSLRWRDSLPAQPPRPGKGPLALRVHLVSAPSSAPGGAVDGGPGGFDVTEAGTQKRLAVYCVRDPLEIPGVARLGVDPLDPRFTLAAFADLLTGSRQQIKGLLRDQSVIAGIGNAYSDEILHAARLSPFKVAGRLGEGEVRVLYDATVETLHDAVRRSRGTAAGELKAGKRAGLRVHGRTGEACPVCGDTVREVSFADSALQYCPACQTGGQPLADRRMSKLLK
ncbi:MAG: Fpg/Nei family DNA glycosylase [Carbonactinosporaceae bacterium]